MRGLGVASVALAVVVAVAVGCGSSGSSSTNGLGNTTTPTSTAANAACGKVTLTASETGVTAKTITVTVIADTGSPIKPGLFRGSVDAVKAWAAYVNDNGGLACRRVVVKTADSRLSADETANAARNACGNSIALVGTSALFFRDVGVLEDCRDNAGKNTGLPDLAVLQTESSQQCSKLSYSVLAVPGSCPYRGAGPRTFNYPRAAMLYYRDTYGSGLHGVQIIPKDLPSTIAVAVPTVAAAEKMGVKTDEEIGMSGAAIQADYTGAVRAIKQHHSTFVRNTLDYTGVVMLRKEAQIQGVSGVKVWDCFLQCYDRRFISTGGGAVEGQYLWLTLLPFEDKGTNAELQAIFKYEAEQGNVPDAFGEQAWLDGELFAQAVNSIVAAHGPNALTRANLLTAVRGIHDFTGGGVAPPTDVGNKTASLCYIGMQVQNGKFVRVHPTTPGQFECAGNEPITVTVDPIKAYTG